MNTKSSVQERYYKRKMERMVNQYKSKQGMKEEEIESIKAMEQKDPEIIDEIACRRRWTHVTKNTSKAIKE